MSTSFFDVPPIPGLHAPEFSLDLDGADLASAPGLLAHRHHVTAVLVGHDGQRWLPKVLRGLAAQLHAPDRVLTVDTGSSDQTGELLAAAGEVITLGRRTGFAAAVNQALTQAGVLGANTSPLSAEPVTTANDEPVTTANNEPVIEWVWILHDDSMPEPDCLRQLLQAVDRSPSVGIAGAKARTWHGPRRLLDVGSTLAMSGRRETGLDRNELDQGQHDDRRDMLTVGSAGMLVAVDLLTEFGGFDPVFRLFGEDTDLSWRAHLAGRRVIVVPEAVVQHVAAASNGARSADAVSGRVHQAQRRAAMLVLLANLPVWLVPLQIVRLALGSLLRFFGLLLVKEPGLALQEARAAVGVLARPDRVWLARRLRKPARRVPASAVRPLLAARTAGLRHAGEALGEVAGLAWQSVRGRRDIGEGSRLAGTGGVAPRDARDVEPARPSMLARVTRRPGWLLLFLLALGALVAGRELLIGDGVLQGGALLPAPQGAAELWQTWRASWHPIGLGSVTPAPVWLLPLAGVATLLLGSAPAAVWVLLLLTVPLAALAAWVLLARLVDSPRLAALGAVAYGLAPAVTGAGAGGHLGVAAAAVVLPLWTLSAWTLLGGGGTRATGRAVSGRWSGGWTAAGMVALTETVLLAAAPALSWVALVLAVAGLLRALTIGAPLRRGRQLWPRLRLALQVLLGFVVLPTVALGPWFLLVAKDLGLLWTVGGVADPKLTDQSIASWAFPLAAPGGPGTPSPWLWAGIAVAAILGLLRPARRAVVFFAWVLVVAGVVVGDLQARASVPLPGGGIGAVWPGAPALVVALGLVLAACAGAQRMRTRLANRGFGLRQPVAVLLVAGALAAPLLSGVAWLQRGTASPLTRGADQTVPALVAAEAAGPTRPRTLIVLPSSGATTVRLAVERASGTTLSAVDLAPAGDAPDPGLTDAFVGLVNGTTLDGARAVAGYDIRYLLAKAPVDPLVAAGLDAAPGVRRISGEAGNVLWRLEPVGAVIRWGVGGAALVPLSSGPGGELTVRLPAGWTSGGTLIVAEDAAPTDGYAWLTRAPSVAGSDGTTGFSGTAGAAADTGRCGPAPVAPAAPRLCPRQRPLPVAPPGLPVS